MAPYHKFKINTDLFLYELLEDKELSLELKVWSSLPQNHQYCICFRNGASVWIILPAYLSPVFWRYKISRWIR